MSNHLGQAAIIARQVSKRIDTATHTVEILKNIDFEVIAANSVAIMGASGSGKSTLLGLLPAWIRRHRARSCSTAPILRVSKRISSLYCAGAPVGFVFQSYQLIPTLTAEENVLLPLDLAGGSNGRDRARDLLDRSWVCSSAAIIIRSNSPAASSSRVALARAFVMRPPILMADEPTGNLDTKDGRLVLDLLLPIESDREATLMLVTHDRELASYADRTITLRRMAK